MTVQGITFKGPRVFIQEFFEERPSIFGIFPSNLGIVGFTKKGIVNKATLVTSFDEFVSVFGGLIDPSKGRVPLSVRAFFENGGSRAYIVRVVASDATKASGILDTDKFSFTAKSEGVWGNDIRVTIEGNPNFKNLTLKKWEKFDVIVEELNEQGVFEAVEHFSSVDLDVGTETSDSYIEKVLNDDKAGSNYVSVAKINGGVPTQLLKVDITGESIATGDGTTKTFTYTLANVPVLEKSVTINDGSQVVTDDGLGHLIGNIDTAGINAIDYDTGQLTVTFNAPPAAGAAIVANYTKLAKEVSVTLSGGSDGVAGIGRNELTHPNLASQDKGIYAFNKVDDVINLIVPDLAGDQLAAKDQVDYAESNRFIFVVLTTPSGFTVKEAINYPRITLGSISEFAALYYPWVKVVEPITGKVIVFPPLGHIVGVYASVDRRKSVGKAPAGLEDGLLTGVIGTERDLSRLDIDELYVARINPIVNFAGSGPVIFGARNLTFNVKTRYIQNRRTLMFVEKVLGKVLESLLFESINDALFGTIRSTMVSILSTFFKQGMFFGATEEEAFFVKVDRSNNPPDQIESGIVVVDVGLALSKPAEFFVLRIIRRKIEFTS